MTNIMFPAGNTCEIYSYPWESSGCTDDRGVTRGYTQDWYFDDGLSSWVSVTENIEIPIGATGDVVSVDADGFTASAVLNVSNEDARVTIDGHLTHTIFTTSIGSLSSGSHDISLKTSGVHKAVYDKTIGYSGLKYLKFTNAPPVGVYGELKLILENSPSASPGATLTFSGVSGDAGTGNVKLDSELNLSGTTHDRLYTFKVWTIDNGQNWFVNNSAGSTYGWDIS